jgi:hypothetical protein
MESGDDVTAHPELLGKSITPPYHKAILTFRRISSMRSPMEKIQCLIDTGKMICTCITEHWQDRLDPSKLIV